MTASASHLHLMAASKEDDIIHHHFLTVEGLELLCWLRFPQPQAPVGLSSVNTNKKNKSFESWVLISWLGMCVVIYSFYELQF